MAYIMAIEIQKKNYMVKMHLILMYYIAKFPSCPQTKKRLRSI